MRVSVIIPAFNAGASIDETLDSVLRQSYRNFEVLVVDDGSDDDTPARVAAFAARDSRVVLLRQQRGGVAAARNFAISRSRGELVAPLDADDLWDPRKLERQVQSLADAPASVALSYCWWRNVDSGGKILYDGPRWRVEGRVFERLVAINFVGSASIPLLRRAPLVEVGGYDERLRREGAQGCEDWDLYLRLAERYELRVVPERLVSYRSHDRSMSSDLETMRRSHELVLADVRRRHAEIPEATFARSRANMCLYLSGVQLKRGEVRGWWEWLRRALGFHPLATVRFVAASVPTILRGALRRAVS